MTMSPSDLSCGTCFFWLLQPNLHLPHRFGETLGQCRRKSPRVVVAGPGQTMSTRWPLTGSTDWCGEHAVPDIGDAVEDVREKPSA